MEDRLKYINFNMLIFVNYYCIPQVYLIILIQHI